MMSGCNHKIYYLDSTSYGEEVIEINTKSKTFNFYRKTSNKTFTNTGTFDKTKEEISFHFTDPIMDSRFGPHYQFDTLETKRSEIEADSIIIQPIDFSTNDPILAQSIYLYDTNLALKASCETDLNGTFIIDDSFVGQELIMYCSHYQPKRIKIPSKKGMKIQPLIKSIGSFDMLLEPRDVVNIWGMEHKFMIKAGGHLMKADTHGKTIKDYIRKRKNEP